MSILPDLHRASSFWNARLRPLHRHRRPSFYVSPWGPFRLAPGRDGCAYFLPCPCQSGAVPRRDLDASLCRDPSHGPCLCPCASLCHSPARDTCPGNGLCRVFHDSYGDRHSRRVFHVDLGLESGNDENVSFYAYQLSGCATYKTSSSEGRDMMSSRLTISTSYRGIFPYPHPFSRSETTFSAMRL